MPADCTTSPDTIALLATLIRQELCLPVDPPRVLVYNTNFDLPPTDDMWVLVSILSDDIFGQGLAYEANVIDDGLDSTQRISRSTNFTVDVFSVTTEARRRRQEIHLALQGDAAQRLSEQYSLRIFRPTPFTDLSQLEASRRLNRFQCQFAVFESFAIRKAVPFMVPQSPYYSKLLVNP